MGSALEILVEDEGNLLARLENVVIQVRTGTMNESVLDRMESAARLTRASTTGPVGGIAVIEEGAALAGPELRARQAQVVRALVSDPRTYLVSVVLGDSVGTRAVRTVMRLLLLRAPRLHTAGSVGEGVDWLVARLGSPSRVVLASAVEQARTRARGL
jgi:hypothetical protein